MDCKNIPGIKIAVLGQLTEEVKSRVSLKLMAWAIGAG